MRRQTYLTIGGAILLTGLLAACGGSNNNPAAKPPAAASSLESNFGSEFAMIFDAPSTATPAALDNNSVPPLQPAAQPVSFP